MEKKEQSYEEKYPLINEVTIEGKSYKLKVGLWAIKELRKALNKPFMEAIVSAEPDDVLLKLKLAIQSGLRKNNDDKFDLITIDMCEDLIDENPSYFGRISTNYIIASNQYYEVASGNETETKTSS